MITSLITGASSGFGEAIARRFAAEGHRIIITGRRKEKLALVSKKITSEFHNEVLALCFDVRKKNEVKFAIDSLNSNWNNIDVLVNNAGGAHGFGTIDEGELDDWDTMIDTNLKGLLYVTKSVLPLMKQSMNPYIFNIGSTAGKYVYEKGNVYCATKFAVDALSQAMRIDLLKKKIRVTAIHPGAAETEFSEVRFKGDKEKAKNVYKGFIPLNANDIADVISYCYNTPKHVNINELVIVPTAQASPFYFNKE